MANQEMFPLLRLPPEIRLQIYKEFLPIEDEADVGPTSRSLEKNKLSILRVNRLIRQEALEVLLSSTTWIVFRIHHLRNEPAVRGGRESQYYVPELQFLEHQPHFDALFGHRYLLVDIAGGPEIDQNAEVGRMTTTMVFPYDEKRFHYFVLDLWKRCEIYPFATLQLSVTPRERQKASWALVKSFMPAGGFQDAVCNGFHERAGGLLEERLTAYNKTWDDVFRVLRHYHDSGIWALAYLDLKVAVDKLWIAVDVFNEYESVLPVKGRWPLPEFEDIPTLCAIGQGIGMEFVRACNLYVDSQRDPYNFKLSAKSDVHISCALGVLCSDLHSKLISTYDHLMKASYYRGLALRNKAEYGSIYRDMPGQTYRRHLQRAAVNLWVAHWAAQSRTNSSEARAIVDSAETELKSIEARLGWTRKETIRHTPLPEDLALLGADPDAERSYDEQSESDYSDWEEEDSEKSDDEQSDDEQMDSENED